jgi:hypothetical protein
MPSPIAKNEYQVCAIKGWSKLESKKNERSNTLAAEGVIEQP